MSETEFQKIDQNFQKVFEILSRHSEILDRHETKLADIQSTVQRIDEKTIPLDEQDELWQRIRRIEEHLGLSHDLPEVRLS